jgi:hypothetical protein
VLPLAGIVSAIGLITSWFEFLRVWEFFGTSLPGILLDVALDGLVLPIWVVWLGILLSRTSNESSTGSRREKRALGLDSYYDDL